MDAVSHCAPGYRFQYQVPPKSPPFSMMRTSCTPASTIRAQVARPAKPPPMNANVTWSVLASRCATGVYGSYAKRPFSGRYCALRPHAAACRAQPYIWRVKRPCRFAAGARRPTRRSSPSDYSPMRASPRSRGTTAFSDSDPSTGDRCRQAIRRTATSGPRSERPLHIGARVSGFVSAHFPDTSAVEVNDA